MEEDNRAGLKLLLGFAVAVPVLLALFGVEPVVRVIVAAVIAALGLFDLPLHPGAVAPEFSLSYTLANQSTSHLVCLDRRDDLGIEHLDAGCQHLDLLGHLYGRGPSCGWKARVISRRAVTEMAKQGWLVDATDLEHSRRQVATAHEQASG